ncbi:MAG: FAD-dependent oxidoreductase [Thermoplasmata archaeon]|nr:FAD-dependent oxidoreductase [Thermoplasmata archaeon]
MSELRITEHPILTPEKREEIEFFFRDRPLKAYKGEMISTALFANGIRIFGEHYKDGSPQGIFCANGQCAQCLVLADGLAVKSCITEVKPGMKVMPLDGLPALPGDDQAMDTSHIPEEFETEVFIMGAGPAGISAAIELGRQEVRVIVADDKHIPGGKLGLQTHNFFGSARECNAGMRGMDIGTLLAGELEKLDSVDIWLNSPVAAVFSDKKIGVVKNGRFVLVRPERFLVAAGARENALAFPGCDLPGVYGAGAFQTLVNRDLVKAAKRLFVVGGGNVGLIVAYHALQAGIDVLGIVEALPECGGYKVHLDKIKRLGVPVWTSHTVLRAEGDGILERVIISEIDKGFRPIPGTEGEFEVDTLLIAVGLSSVNEMFNKAREFGIECYAAGDADIIAEASAAAFSGQIVGRKILQDMGLEVPIPGEWDEMVKILRSKPGKIYPLQGPNIGSNKIYPVIRCVQEIPCNPCAENCLLQSLSIKSESIMALPTFGGRCAGCGHCVSICPGLAITLVDEGYDNTREKALAIIPWEMPEGTIRIGEVRTTTGFEGEVIGQGRIIAIREAEWQNRRKLVYIETPFNEARLVAGIRIREPASKMAPLSVKAADDAEVIVCRCERVTKRQIMDKIRDGCRDFNALKAELRTGMGPCGGKTCIPLIWGIFRECGVDLKEVEPHIYRPFELEVPLRAFIDETEEGKE